MAIDWNAFTPWPSLAGGVLVGIAAAMLVLLNGRVAGVSGIVGGLLRPGRGDVAWRVAFALGLVGSPFGEGAGGGQRCKRCPRTVPVAPAHRPHFHSPYRGFQSWGGQHC